jgi:hypothetical protein
MDRAEASGIGIALVGHAAVFAALSVGLMRAAGPPVQADPIEISFVEEVALRSASPAPAAAPPPPSAAPEFGPTEEAAPAPTPAPAPPRPEPTVLRPAPTRQAAAPPPRDARDRRRPEEARAGQAQRNRGSRLADLDLSGLGRDPSPARTPQSAPAATMSAQAAADIGQAILRQVQPCANRQVHPENGTERIRTRIQLRLNRDGSMAARPQMLRQTGLDDENRRYSQRVADLAERIFIECSPLRGLPQELYDVPRGWSNFVLDYRLPG